MDKKPRVEKNINIPCSKLKIQNGSLNSLTKLYVQDNIMAKKTQININNSLQNIPIRTSDLAAHAMQLLVI